LTPSQSISQVQSSIGNHASSDSKVTWVDPPANLEKHWVHFKRSNAKLKSKRFQAKCIYCEWTNDARKDQMIKHAMANCKVKSIQEKHFYMQLNKIIIPDVIEKEEAVNPSKSHPFAKPSAAFIQKAHLELSRAIISGISCINIRKCSFLLLGKPTF
jgi:hypothetical protein